ncbi:hypothetical protein PAPYR_2134 [Paratrimastix pyriformis]|uniref:COMM domain-containing protein n=1 Tax=Paratrimastix pyriformis TaxID=342808 RepID=A0ABQ8URS3_9EUKA|nr:hypothetical protein PAPYR_2134 [Paratrimastix pyriformis]
MKFNFCGRLDCPDWVLSEIAIVSRISSIRIKLICAQVVKHIIDGFVDFAKVEKLTSAQGLSKSDMHAAMAVLRFILANAARYETPESTLIDELQQIGLPREHCDQIHQQYVASKETMIASLKARTLALPHLEDVQWRVDYIACSSVTPPDTPTGAVGEASVQLKLRATQPTPPGASATSRQCLVELTAAQLHTLLTELRTARGAMEQIRPPADPEAPAPSQ